MTDVRQGDLRRLARSVWLDVTGMGPGLYRVTGGTSPHEVRFTKTQRVCDCPDHTMNGNANCKHVLAVRLAKGDLKVRRALRLLIPQPATRAAR